MTSPTLLPGNRFRAYRSAGGTPEVFNFVCIAQTIGVTRTNEFEDATVPDCDTPLSIPNRKSVLRSRAWSARISGIVDAKRFAAIRQDAESETPVRYQFMVDQTAANGGGTWTGAIFIESLEVTKNNNGMVNFTAQMRGDDVLVWADAA
ncbi:phage tail tube protein [Methylobacterium sp. JK268]